MSYMFDAINQDPEVIEAHVKCFGCWFYDASAIYIKCGQHETNFFFEISHIKPGSKNISTKSDH
jgi:hypothetical protein